MRPEAEPFYPQHDSTHTEAGEGQPQGEGTWQFRHKSGPSEPPWPDQLIAAFRPDEFDITDQRDASWYELSGGDEQLESGGAETSGESTQHMRSEPRTQGGGEESSIAARIEAAAAQAIEEAIQRRISIPHSADDEWYQEEQDAMEELRAAEAAEESTTAG